MDEKYIEIVKAINDLINEFNEFLSAEFKINQFDQNEFNNPNYFTARDLASPSSASLRFGFASIFWSVRLAGRSILRTTE